MCCCACMNIMCTMSGCCMSYCVFVCRRPPANNKLCQCCVSRQCINTMYPAWSSTTILNARCVVHLCVACNDSRHDGTCVVNLNMDMFVLCVKIHDTSTATFRFLLHMRMRNIVYVRLILAHPRNWQQMRARAASQDG